MLDDALLWLLETYYTFNAAEYNALFQNELEKVITRTNDPERRLRLEAMRTFDWISYIAASVRNAGFRDYRDGQEKIHDIAVKLLTGKLFSGWDEKVSGPMDLRFKKSVANAIRNLAEKERNRRHYLPTVPIGNRTSSPVALQPTSCPHGWDQPTTRRSSTPSANLCSSISVTSLLPSSTCDCRAARRRALSVRLKSAGKGKDSIKRLVRRIKQLAQAFAASRGDQAFLRRIEKAMADEEATFEKRRAAMAGRRNR